MPHSERSRRREGEVGGYGMQIFGEMGGKRLQRHGRRGSGTLRCDKRRGITYTAEKEKTKNDVGNKSIIEVVASALE